MRADHNNNDEQAATVIDINEQDIAITVEADTLKEKNEVVPTYPSGLEFGEEQER